MVSIPLQIGDRVSVEDRSFKRTFTGEIINFTVEGLVAVMDDKTQEVALYREDEVSRLDEDV